MLNTLLKNSTASLLIIASLAIKAQINIASAIGSSGNEYSSKLRGSGLAFTPNKGQIANIDGKPCPEVLYKGQSQVADIYLRKTGISYVQSNMGEVMHKIDKQIEELSQTGVLDKMDEQKKKDELMQKEKIKIHRVDMDFDGANTNCRLINEDELDGYNNYYYAHCPQGITKVRQYNRVTYKNIYKGIDIKYYGDKQKGIKYDLIVHPHADPKQIKIHWKGAEKIKLESSKLQVESSLGTMTETLPKVYQNINGKIVDVECKYILDMRCEMLDLRGRHYGSQSHVSCLKSHIYEVSFELGTYNLELPLIIDPYWATYYGGNQPDYGTDIDTDISGNVVLTGSTWGGTFPANNNGIGGSVTWQGVHNGNYDVFVVKFDSNGNRLWATFYGGNTTDEGNAIATDNANNIVVTGRTISNNFPVNNNGLGGNTTWQTVNGGNWDVFIVKFDSNGNRLWATFYGGNQTEYGFGITVDNTDNISVVGVNYGGFFPANNNGIGGNVSWQPLPAGNSEAFVVKFDALGNRLWATYYGGDKKELAYDIDSDSSGNIVIVGSTEGGTFPANNNGIGGNNTWQSGFGGGIYDVFVVKFDTFGNRLWATFYGGDQIDEAYGISIDYAQNIVVAGYSRGGNFPANNNGIGGNFTWQQLYGGGATDAIVVKFDSFGNRLWATYFGTNLIESAWNVDTDRNNNIYLLMETEDAATPPLGNCSWQSVFGGVEDQTIVKFSPLGIKQCDTYLGGTGEDELEPSSQGGIVVFGNFLYITAGTNGGFPVTPGAAQTVFGGINDPYVAQLCINICEGKTIGLDFTANTTALCSNTPVTFTPSVTNSCDTTGYRFHWEFAGGNPAVSDSVNPTVKFSNSGTHDVKLVVTTLCKKDSIIKTNYITTTTCNTCTLAGQFTKGTATCTNCGCQEWVLVNGVNGTPPYTYQWPDGYDKRYKNKLCQGNYTVKVTDKNGCSVDVNVSTP